MEIVLPVIASIAAATVAGVWFSIRQAVSRLYADQRADRAETHAERKYLQAELKASREERAACREQLAKLEATVEAKLEARHDRNKRGEFID